MQREELESGWKEDRMFVGEGKVEHSIGRGAEWGRCIGREGEPEGTDQIGEV